ncbi:xanthine dehydrogenase family protein molybdopterin-binding subunit [Polaribacter sp. WD7]|uniref:xanthine dehydrogenase family protein molybdopterin-binding subunit n=1 Tax=Polaribacter sp. WD7 TaxID=2269061 RepID=UPI000DF2693B|nr:molybdopterin cofactor-binding domain-containing protein [Polaribacter sp. WD7]RCS26008.1 xanthine dehydrogenase family protein molybdopterin-binding subunit [Polaribacter sp. WD7]
MKSQKHINFSRRNFLKTSVLASGGMLIGFNFLTACKADAKMPVAIENLNFNDFNAYIKISDEGYVTIFSPNPEIGQGVKTSMPMIIAEELDVEWNKVSVVQGNLDTKNFTRQVAGGSQSIRSSWTVLRQTGATAKQMLINAAALKWNVDATTCKAKKGIITNANGDKLGYGDVVKEAALLEVPENIKLKKTKEFTIIGKDATNVDIDKIITGKPLFGLDYKKDNMMIASVLRPPAFGQKLISFDDSNTKAISGVKEVIQFGDKIAVLASSTWSAMKGKKALQAKWKDKKLESTENHDKILNEILNQKKLKVRREDGNIKKAFATADKVIERTYHAPFLPHNCMEPMNFYANVTDTKVHLVGPIQTPEWTVNRVAKLLQRKVETIQCDMTRMGGGFGRRLYGDFALEAAEISSVAKKPVKVVYSREDDMTAGRYKPSVKYKIAASLKDGKITGYHLKEAAINGNMYGLIPNFFPAGCIPNYKVETSNYKSNITTGAWRAPYTNFLAFAEQSFFDELATELNKDVIELRLELLQKVKNTTDESIEYSGQRMEDAIALVKEKANWGKVPSGVYQGFAAYYSHNTHVAEIADIVLKDGFPEIKKVTVAADCGIVVNPTGAINQIQGGVLDGIGHAMYADFSFKEGKPVHKNFDTYRLIRMQETPKVEVHFVENNLSPSGLGEPGLPPAGGAVANAIYAALGKRLYKQPFINGLKKSNVLG